MSTYEKLQELLAGPITLTPSGLTFKNLTPAIVCADGTSMSVQASEDHYSTPRENEGPYTAVEVWHCGSPDLFNDYGDGEYPYAYVPIELVVQEIDRRGGFKS